MESRHLHSRVLLHRHPGCRFAADPVSNPDFWDEKFRRNTVRDKRVQDALPAAGWRIGTVWKGAWRKPVWSVTLTGIENWINRERNPTVLTPSRIVDHR
jgi:G:T-mismatch repair DNA endonuclease (very short patch repair protein)